jgi:hypothetical protein
MVRKDEGDLIVSLTEAPQDLESLMARVCAHHANLF